MANSTSLASGAPIAAILLVDGATGVAVTDLTVDGMAAAFNACSPGYVGIFYRASSGLIQDTHVTHIHHPAASGCQAVLGIFVQSGNGGPGLNSHVTILQNRVDDYGKNGITANEPGTFVTVSNNIVMGRGPTTFGDAAQNGVQIGFGARGLVSGNTAFAARIPASGAPQARGAGPAARRVVHDVQGLASAPERRRRGGLNPGRPLPRTAPMRMSRMTRADARDDDRSY